MNPRWTLWLAIVILTVALITQLPPDTLILAIAFFGLGLLGFVVIAIVASWAYMLFYPVIWALKKYGKKRR